ncbi:MULTISPECIES: hypothetical protein [unclassified Actinomadura]|uniref:hypothetical protein n=1 Tax=unclassified Actinomadura TaxID=2626254 RepID=UPI0011EC665F|nr:hypothetical protein [Actinomadura sp. K4S16]
METTAGPFLAIYLNDHLAGAAAGVGRSRALAQAHQGRPDEERLQRLADDIAADRGALLAIMGSLGIAVRHYKSIALSVAEKAGRLKFNGRLKERSPLTDLVEYEFLRLAVEGKAAGWRTLRTLADRTPDLEADELETLHDRAEAQIDLLEELRKSAVAEVFTG